MKERQKKRNFRPVFAIYWNWKRTKKANENRTKRIAGHCRCALFMRAQVRHGLEIGLWSSPRCHYCHAAALAQRRNVCVYCFDAQLTATTHLNLVFTYSFMWKWLCCTRLVRQWDWVRQKYMCSSIDTTLSATTMNRITLPFCLHTRTHT